jgi:type IV secretion system protein VirD4
VWAPYDETGNTHRFNPMSTLAGMDPGKRIGEIQTIAAILYPDEQGKDPFWTSQGRAAFTAFASYLFEAWDDEFGQLATTKASSRVLPDINISPKFPSLERILRFSSGTDGQSTKEGFYPEITDGCKRVENFKSSLAVLRRILGFWRRSMYSNTSALAASSVG